MRLYTKAYKDGYKDYVNGFENSVSDPEYQKGYNDARAHFFRDVPYDEEVLGGMYW